MEGWMMSLWMDGWMNDGWMGQRVGGWIYLSMAGLMGEYKDGQTSGWLDILMNKHKYECIDGSVDRWATDEYGNGWTEGWLNR